MGPNWATYHRRRRLEINARECPPALHKSKHPGVRPGGGRVRSVPQVSASGPPSSGPLRYPGVGGCTAFQNRSPPPRLSTSTLAPSNLFSYIAQGTQSGPVFSLPASICRGDRACGILPRDASETTKYIIYSIYTKSTYVLLSGASIKATYRMANCLWSTP